MEPSPRYGYVGPVSDSRDALADEPDNEHLLEESDVEPAPACAAPGDQGPDDEDGDAAASRAWCCKDEDLVDLGPTKAPMQMRCRVCGERWGRWDGGLVGRPVEDLFRLDTDVDAGEAF